MKSKVQLIPSAQKDFKKLDGREKLLVAKQLNKLASKPFLGAPLGKRAGIDLTGYFKLYADRKRLRVVYRCVGEELDVEIIAIGRREDFKVYQEAEKRKDQK